MGDPEKQNVTVNDDSVLKATGKLMQLTESPLKPSKALVESFDDMHLEVKRERQQTQ